MTDIEDAIRYTEEGNVAGLHKLREEGTDLQAIRVNGSNLAYLAMKHGQHESLRALGAFYKADFNTIRSECLLN